MKPRFKPGPNSNNKLLIALEKTYTIAKRYTLIFHAGKPQKRPLVIFLHRIGNRSFLPMDPPEGFFQHENFGNCLRASISAFLTVKVSLLHKQSRTSYGKDSFHLWYVSEAMFSHPQSLVPSQNTKIHLTFFFFFKKFKILLPQ